MVKANSVLRESKDTYWSIVGLISARIIAPKEKLALNFPTISPMDQKYYSL